MVKKWNNKEENTLKEIAVELLKERIKLIDQTDNRALYLVGPIKLPVNLEGNTVIFQWYSWLNTESSFDNQEQLIEQLAKSNLADMQQSSVLVYGDFSESTEALIRMHSICHTGDIFGSKRCDCGFQLKKAMQLIVENGSGALFYLANHEGRGIGLFSKAMAYILQENGYDTVDANIALGFEDDKRSYEEAITVLQYLRKKPVTLITNNPKKLEALERSGLFVTDRLSLWGDVSVYNENYLNTKMNRSGHMKGEALSGTR
ncbi:GTP cyclohydrolase II [Bacillus taeanensis]|uniref:GTP cyclohydrolase II n=1 Tax=Bacillus taeanensis TaxID=273032 RepID=A0A366Y014_9BACI|nr:GTP cyclohydrolase II [Bacillus taeanensis]RBW71168.1 GTP cyclohydrolase II [Bacillus taeanensis]